MAGVKFGKGMRVDKHTCLCVRNGSCITVGSNVYLRSNRDGYHTGMPYPATLLADGLQSQIIIGDNCRINGAYVHAQRMIEIGSNCVIAAGVNIIDSNGHQVHSANRTIGRDKPEPIRLGNNVWIGVNTVILKNTTIGDNCVVSAGSVVKGIFPANSIIQGNPAMVIGEVKI